ncbi:MAG TPA: alpha/beta fold hydrolase, partial [Solirubrobacteraceae bacterium]|nr:alpha/beta fold hydrolase [Solirubrobacteraceae bacterium]
MRSSRSLPLLLVITLGILAAACEREPVGPPGVAAPPVATAQASGDEGPPPKYNFGQDTYRTGVFTGEGVTPTGLQCTTFADGQGQVCNGFLASNVDGTRLDVRLAVPAGAAGVLHPLVVLVHGYGGSKSSSSDIADSLYADGYAVLRYSTRGFGKSWGQVNLADEHAEIADLRSMVGQVVDDPRFSLDPDAVAVTGASYGGGHSWLSLLQPTFRSPRGAGVRIRAIAPIAPWTDLLYALAPNGSPRESLDRPGAAKISWIDALFVGGAHEPTEERPYVNYPDYLVAWGGYLNGAEPNEVDPIYRQLGDGLAGYRSVWWRKDFWRQVAQHRVPIFQVQGLTDDLFPLPEGLRMLLALRTVDPAYPITSYFGDLGHPRARNKQREVDHVLRLMRTWLA